MKDFRNLKLWALRATCLAAGLLAAGCSTYRPLERGSHVPWAQTVAVPPLSGAAAARQEQAADMVRAAKEVPGGRTHRVERGEYLAAIARRHGVGLHQLAAANDIGPPYTIYAGQTLRIPEGDAPARDAGPQPLETDIVHVVVRGETLSAIARRYDVPSGRLVEINGLRPPYHVLAGQELSIPASGDVRVASQGGQPGVTPIAALKVPSSFEGDGFLWPVSGKVVGRFGRTDDGQRRNGIDIAARKGAPVRAAQNGVVVYAGDAIKGYGRMILLRHEADYLTTYAHNSALLVNVGDKVERGQVIARMGDRLHFELRKGRKPIDPEALLVPLPTEVASSDQY